MSENRLSKLVYQIWNSATMMTWGSFASQSLNLVIVLPLLLTKLETAEISLWYLFSTIISLQMLSDIGFTPTFSRVISYAMAGATYKELGSYRKPKLQNSHKKPDVDTLKRICSTMHKVYFVLAIVITTVILVAGSLCLDKPISSVSNTQNAWLSWGIILFGSTIIFHGNIYSAFLQGTNNIALLRRLEICISLCSIGSNFVVLLAGGGLLGLVASHQSWRVVNVLCNRILCSKTKIPKPVYTRSTKMDIVVLKSVWPSTWRSGLGLFMSRGLIEMSGLLYAQVGSSAKIATYLFGLRMIQMVSQFSMAPFYSKLPILARLRASGDLINQVKIAKQGMKFSYWSYFIGFSILGILGPYLMTIIGSNADFPDFYLWGFLGIAMFAERYGAMHIQLYSITNHIVWHHVTFFSGSIFLIVSISLFRFIDIYAFPVALMVSYVGFYSWFCARYSYKAFKLNFIQFESDTLLFPLIAFILYLVIHWTLSATHIEVLWL